MVLYRWAIKVWKQLSVTEKEALLRPFPTKFSFIGNLLSGKKNPLLRPVELNKNESEQIHNWSQQLLVNLKDDLKMESFLSKEKMYGLEIPTKYGGLGYSPYFHSRWLTRIASVDRSGKWIHQMMVPNSLGPAQLLLRYGTETQCHSLLPDISDGKKIPCFGLTGPFNGSDASAMPITGKMELRQGRFGIRFSCEKRWITLAPIAQLLGLAIRVQDYGICLLLIDRTKLSEQENQSISVRWHRPIGSSFPNGHIQINDLWVSIDECVIGGKNGLDKGWKMLMECLQHGRGISLPSVSLGSTASLVNQCTWYCLVRRQFKQPLLCIYGVQSLVAENILLWISMKSLNEYYHAILETGEQSSSFSAFMKWIMTEMNRTVVLNSMDIFAGKAITLGDKNPIVHHYLQNPISITVEGSNTLSQHLIVPIQTLFEHHPYFIHLISALEKENSKLFYETIRKWTLDLMQQIPLSNSSKLVWKQFQLLCYGSQLRKRQDLTKLFANEVAHFYLIESIQWYMTHHPYLRELADPLQEWINHRIQRQKRGLPSHWNISRIESISHILLKNTKVRHLLEDDILWEKNEPIQKIRDLWINENNDIGKPISKRMEIFSNQLSEEIQRSVIDVDSYENLKSN